MSMTIGISIGDPNGIGPEVVLKTFTDSELLKVPGGIDAEVGSEVSFSGVLDEGFLMPNSKTVVQKAHFEWLFNKAQDEFRLLEKITPLHLHCVGSDRQRVHLATQLFSETVADAISKFFKGAVPQEWKDVMRFVRGANDFFVMAKEIAGIIKLQIKGGAANPSPPVGPALGAKGVKN